MTVTSRTNVAASLEGRVVRARSGMIGEWLEWRASEALHGDHLWKCNSCICIQGQLALEAKPKRQMLT